MHFKHHSGCLHCNLIYHHLILPRPGEPVKRQRCHGDPGSALAHEMLYDVSRGEAGKTLGIPTPFESTIWANDAIGTLVVI